MRVLFVCGDRNWSDDDRIQREVDVRQPNLVLQGGCRGADLKARKAAQWRGIHAITVDAIWDFWGKTAGPMRNKMMVSILTVFKEAGWNVTAVAFHADLANSKGTKNMIALLQTAGFTVEVITQ